METKGRILVIDDELGIRQGCRRVLEPEGYVVEQAANVQEGLDVLRGSTFDLVLLDVMLPDGRGVDLLPRIFELDPETVCLIITGYATVELAVQAIKRGAYDFISKPFTADLLILTVEQGLEKRRLSLEARRLRQVEQRAEELARAKEEMERLDRYKTQFMWTMAHELRSPVGGALSLLRTLRHSVGSTFTAQQMDILGRIERRMDSLMDLINDLLALAGSKAVEPDEPLGPVALTQTLSRVVDEFRVEAMAKSIQLGYNPLDGEVYVQGTEDGLGKIFRNLIGNAIKYTPENGQVEVQVEPESDRITITVSDTGIGIPEAEVPALFDEFYRGTNAKKAGINGTGLGLSIVKQYVERFGGQIDVSSVEGRGSEFAVRLVTADQKT